MSEEEGQGVKDVLKFLSENRHDLYQIRVKFQELLKAKGLNIDDKHMAMVLSQKFLLGNTRLGVVYEEIAGSLIALQKGR